MLISILHDGYCCEHTNARSLRPCAGVMICIDSKPFTISGDDEKMARLWRRHETKRTGAIFTHEGVSSGNKWPRGKIKYPLLLEKGASGGRYERIDGMCFGVSPFRTTVQMQKKMQMAAGDAPKHFDLCTPNTKDEVGPKMFVC